MLVYIIRRLMQAALVMVVMSAVVFAGIYVIGDPVAMMISPDASQLEREVSLDGGIYLGRAAVIDVPAAVGLLQGKYMLDGLAFPLLVHTVVPMVVSHHVRNQGGIHDQFADPIAFGFLDG